MKVLIVKKSHSVQSVLAMPSGLHSMLMICAPSVLRKREQIRATGEENLGTVRVFLFLPNRRLKAIGVSSHTYQHQYELSLLARLL